MWEFPDVAEAEPGQDLLAIGGDLSPENLLRAYATGLFPMNVTIDDEPSAPLSTNKAIGWWSPDPRGILPLENIKISRSLKKSCRRYRVTFDLSFEAVMRGCQVDRAAGWITPDYVSAYTELHRLRYAHSVEVRNRSGGLIGGLYGVEIGGLFAGESMFHLARDASKVALVALADVMWRANPTGRLLDVQWQTDHLATLGVTEVSRAEYLERLAAAIQLPKAFPPR